ncbi:hypothetical protein [Micromonospora musae]|uniref:hypothetical protein n=1 Tax=Micromonospora musae TaxID=1894970 RepID=UPI0034387693
MLRRAVLAIAVPLGFLGATLVAAPALAGEPAGADLRAGAAVSAADDAAECAADKAAKSADGSTMTPTVELNPCADIDLSQIIDCRSGTCYKFCWDVVHPYHYEWCESKKANIRHRNWISYPEGSRIPSACSGGAPAV